MPDNRTGRGRVDEPKLCGIESAMGWTCDFPWGHDGDLHSSHGDGYYAREHDALHKCRQAKLAAGKGGSDGD